MEKVGADPKRTVLVSDIGCVGLADKYFLVHTFHGLHGRSFTYACGIKIAHPDLNVFVVVGDGGCGIGGHHLINAARRNIGIKVICFDNFNFGMTGGEHSITTPCEGITHSTPYGNIERPTHYNTSWDEAKYEVCGHKWADLSEGNYGVSILNDSKYGWDIFDNVMRLSLLKSPTRPSLTMDRGEHDFVYSVYPHAGTWREGGTFRQAYQLNVPAVAIQQSKHDGEHAAV